MKGGVRKRNNAWYYYFDLGIVEGKRKKIERKAIGATTKGEAESFLRRAITEYENAGTIFEPSQTTLHDYLKFWFEEYVMLNLKHNTQENYRNVIEKHILPAIGKYKLKSLKPDILQKFINDKKRDGYSHMTLTIFQTVLNSSIKQAVYPYKLVSENPMQYVTLPKKEQKKTTESDLKILSMETIKKIISYLDENHPFYIPFHIGFHTGLRVSEVCGLEWSSVDLDERKLKVEKIVINKNGEWVFSTPKTESSKRTIDIGGSLTDILKRHRTKQKENKLKYGENYITNDFVCTKESGAHVTPSVVKWNTRHMKEVLGIEFNFHSLRHTHATLLLERGAPIKDIQTRLGHSRSGITLDTYSHLTDNMKNQTVDIFEGIMKDVKSPKNNKKRMIKNVGKY